jgi:excisionase family DNA binding protein
VLEALKPLVLAAKHDLTYIVAKNSTVEQTTLGTTPEHLYLPDEVAGIIRWHPESVRRAIRDGRIQAVKIGRGWRVRAGEIQKLIQQGF